MSIPHFLPCFKTMSMKFEAHEAPKMCRSSGLQLVVDMQVGTSVLEKHCLALKMAVCSSETLVSVYKSTQL
jgi:hypothetical protein